MSSLAQFQEQLNDPRICQELTLDAEQGEVSLDGKRLPVTSQELRILTYLADRPGKPASRSELREALWGSPRAGEGRTIDAYVASLRAKIRIPALITTVRSVGYAFNKSGSCRGAKPFVVTLVR